MKARAFTFFIIEIDSFLFGTNTDHLIILLKKIVSAALLY